MSFAFETRRTTNGLHCAHACFMKLSARTSVSSAILIEFAALAVMFSSRRHERGVSADRAATSNQPG